MNRQIATHLTINLPMRQLSGLLALAFAATASVASAGDAKVANTTEAAPAIASENGADLEKHGDRFKKAIAQRDALSGQPEWTWDDGPEEIMVGSR